jgi:dTDP-glucose pyrophosphorylase/CBS domain-containing protein
LEGCAGFGSGIDERRNLFLRSPMDILHVSGGEPVEDVKERVEGLLIRVDSSIRDALAVMDRYHVGMALVVNNQRRLVGTVADRDVRRALLAGRGLGEPIASVTTKEPVTATEADRRVDVLDLMRCYDLGEIPVVDEAGHVVGLHARREFVAPRTLGNWAVVMAGGRGKRLAPLTDTLPKPMLPVAGRPILERIVHHLVGSGIRRICISLNYLADVIENHFGDGSNFGCEIEYLRERPDVPLGTGGALRLLADLERPPVEPLIVMNGDLLTDFPVADILACHERQPVAATIAVTRYVHQVPFGVVESAGGRLTGIVEKPVSSWPVNAGIYVIEPELTKRIPPAQDFPITALFDDCLRRGERVGLWELRDEWQDIGRPAELAHARGQW